LHRFADRIFAFTEAALLAYDDIIAPRRSITAADGMIAAVRRIDGGRLATRNPADFATTDLELIRRWDF
jgi:predicted nucleic acid-binding protein